MAGIDTYKHDSVMTQSKERLIVLLYEGAVKFLRQAITQIEANDTIAKGRSIAKAVDIIDELNVCLDMEAGGQIAENLRALYNFMRRHLSQANLKRDPQMIQEVIKLLEDLNDGWKAVTG